MIYTKENILSLLKDFSELQAKADEFVNRDYPAPKYTQSPGRINYDTYEVEREENTACNCHPEYEWKSYAKLDDFVAWLVNQPVAK